MKEFIKKFESATSANNYPIVDIPFTTSVAPSSGYPLIDYIQNLVCNQIGKKLVNNDGIVEVQSDVPEGFVDLGLQSGTLWAKYNLGVNPEQLTYKTNWYGDFYAWGEIETKSDYSWSTYKHANGAFNKLTKYCDDSTYGNEGYTDELTQLVPTDDVATETNSVWKIPTKDDFEELIAGTTNSWVTNYNGVSGLDGKVFTGTNGNTLFIPAAGNCDGSKSYQVGTYGFLWSSSLKTTSNPDAAFYLRVGSSSSSMGLQVSTTPRNIGFNIRPVQHVS